MIRIPGLFEGSPCAWADLGCGSGLFTRALAHALPEGSIVYGIDRQAQSIPPPARNRILFRQADITQEPLPLPPVNGIMMANALHYVSDKPALLQQLRSYFSGPGKWLVVEYDTTDASPWVPYPVDFTTLQQLFRAAGYRHIRKLSTRQSAYGNGDLYAAFVS